MLMERQSRPSASPTGPALHHSGEEMMMESTNLTIGDRVKVLRPNDRHYGHLGTVIGVDPENGMVKVGDLPDEGEIISRVGRSYRSRNLEKA
ncbi:MAG: hypothetical protein CV089_23920 [Nitrospira sp. WS110]|nr:hypothetical protein [Nitrospira sp. WS110]